MIDEHVCCWCGTDLTERFIPHACPFGANFLIRFITLPRTGPCPDCGQDYKRLKQHYYAAHGPGQTAIGRVKREARR